MNKLEARSSLGRHSIEPKKKTTGILNFWGKTWNSKVGFSFLSSILTDMSKKNLCFSIFFERPCLNGFVLTFKGKACLFDIEQTCPHPGWWWPISAQPAPKSHWQAKPTSTEKSREAEQPATLPFLAAACFRNLSRSNMPALNPTVARTHSKAAGVED